MLSQFGLVAMALFSEGGMTSPDIWIIVVIILIAFISTIFNPLVFKHSCQKKKSIARDLFMVLSSADFVTSIVIATTACVRIAAPKEKQCEVDHNITFCQQDYFKYNRTATAGERAIGGIMWTLVIFTIITSAVLAVSRWYQITYPLRYLNRKAVDIALGMCFLLFAAYFQWSFLHGNFRDNLVVFKMYMQTVDVVKSDDVNFYLPFSFTSLFTFTSAIASAVTVLNIFKSRPAPGLQGLRSRRMRSSLKVAILNAGNLIWIGSLMIKLADKENIHLQMFLGLLSILQSAYNPIVYVLLTKETLISNGQV